MKNKQLNFAVIAENIRKMRKLKEMTQSELAEKVHVSKRSVNAWEKGTTNPNLINVLSICNVFDVRVDDFIGSSFIANHY